MLSNKEIQMKYVCRFTKERETRGTIRFKEDSSPGVPPVIGTLYVKKWALPLNTQSVLVTVEIPEDEDVVTFSGDIPAIVGVPEEQVTQIIGESYPAD